jgi:hypothetical protein
MILPARGTRKANLRAACPITRHKRETPLAYLGGASPTCLTRECSESRRCCHRLRAITGGMAGPVLGTNCPGRPQLVSLGCGGRPNIGRDERQQLTSKRHDVRVTESTITQLTVGGPSQGLDFPRVIAATSGGKTRFPNLLCAQNLSPSWGRRGPSHPRIGSTTYWRSSSQGIRGFPSFKKDAEVHEVAKVADSLQEIPLRAH